MKVYNVILSGGVGSRLWPLSRQKNPKQFLKLFAEKSLFELTAERNENLVDELLVVGNAEHIEISRDFLQDITIPKNFVTESVARNTAAAIAFASFAVEEDDILIITPSDHLIEDQKLYEKSMKEAVILAKKNYLVTFGIIPSKPETGYGYIEHQGENVISFREKPNKKTAQDFLDRETFLWNSGMFCFKAGLFLEELKNYQPEVYEKSLEAWNKSIDGVLDYQSSLEIPSISIDYAVMEKSKLIKVVPAKFQWNDLGSFESLYEYLKTSDHPVDTSGNMVIGTEIFTSFVGVENCIFVHTEDAMMILQKESSQEVKNVYNKLEQDQSPLR